MALSHLASTVLDPLWLLAATYKFPDGDHYMPMALDPLHL